MALNNSMVFIFVLGMFPTFENANAVGVSSGIMANTLHCEKYGVPLHYSFHDCPKNTRGPKYDQYMRDAEIKKKGARRRVEELARMSLNDPERYQRELQKGAEHRRRYAKSRPNYYSDEYDEWLEENRGDQRETRGPEYRNHASESRRRMIPRSDFRARWPKYRNDCKNLPRIENIRAGECIQATERTSLCEYYYPNFKDTFWAEFSGSVKSHPPINLMIQNGRYFVIYCGGR